MASNVTADWTLKVDPSVLESQAQAVRTANDELNGCFDRMKNLMNQTEYFWTGAAADAHRNSYNKNQTAIEEIIARYTEHVRDLEEIARNFGEAKAKSIKQVDSMQMFTF